MSSQAQTVLLLRLAILMAGACTVGRAEQKADEKPAVHQEAEEAPTIRHTDWREALHTEFKFTPATPPAPGDAAVPPPPVTETETNPEVVVLPKFEIKDNSPDYRELAQAQRPHDKRAETLRDRLGIGVHEHKFRHFSFGYATIFYIPVAFGFSW
jgi:hypothetical protein